MKAYNRSKEKKEAVDRSMQPLYDKIAKAMPGQQSGQKYQGRSDSNAPGHDCRYDK